MFVAAGWDVIDMGKDVKLNAIVEEQKNTKADVVALSSLMTSSMLAMPKAIEMLRNADPDVKIMIGGAPITMDIAKQYGADGYADDAVSAVRKAAELIHAGAVA
jgi:methanogenic corrinoid protein MtbC1